MRRTTLNGLVAVMLALSVITVAPRLAEQISKMGAGKADLSDRHESVPASQTQTIEFQTVPSSVAAVFPPRYARLLADGQHGELRYQLTDQASQHVASNDDAALARTLSLLGETSVEAGDLQLAELYFKEALQMYRETDNVLGVAGTEMSLGLVNLDRRRQAVAAGTSYDRLLLARWKLSDGQLIEAEQEVLEIIRSELSLNRYGAAANAYATLTRVYQQNGDDYAAQQALRDAMQHYARVGNTTRAQAMLKELASTRIDETELAMAQGELNDTLQRFRSERFQLATADDYRMLYRHFKATGNRQRAWELRQKASQAMRSVPTDAQIRRRSDSLVLLYSSNDSVRKARRYLTDAGNLYQQQGEMSLAEQTAGYLEDADEID